MAKKKEAAPWDEKPKAEKKKPVQRGVKVVKPEKILDFNVDKMTLGAVVDKLYELKQERAERQKTVDAVKKAESAVEQYLIDTMPKSDQSGVIGRTAKAVIITSKKPSVTDWDKVYAYIKKNNRFDLLQKRVSDTAVKELWDDGKDVPGVDVYNAKKISLTKK